MCGGRVGCVGGGNGRGKGQHNRARPSLTPAPPSVPSSSAVPMGLQTSDNPAPFSAPPPPSESLPPRPTSQSALRAETPEHQRDNAAPTPSGLFGASAVNDVPVDEWLRACASVGTPPTTSHLYCVHELKSGSSLLRALRPLISPLDWLAIDDSRRPTSPRHHSPAGGSFMGVRYWEGVGGGGGWWWGGSATSGRTRGGGGASSKTATSEEVGVGGVGRGAHDPVDGLTSFAPSPRPTPPPLPLPDPPHHQHVDPQRGRHHSSPPGLRAQLFGSSGGPQARHAHPTRGRAVHAHVPAHSPSPPEIPAPARRG